MQILNSEEERWNEDIARSSPMHPWMCFVIPGWLWKNFTNRYSANEFFEYSKLRSVCSTDDVAELIALNSYFESDILRDPNGRDCAADFYFTESVLNKSVKPLTPDEQNELTVTVSAKAYLRQTVDSVVNRLKSVDENRGSEAWVSSEPELSGHRDENQHNTFSAYYDVLSANGGIYIVVEEAFLSKLSEKTNRLDFYTRVLETAYGIYPVATVNATSWYRQYAQALKA